jgi:predicted permease
LTRRRLLIAFAREEAPVSNDADWSQTDGNLTSPGYFDTLGIRLVRGRDFTEQDDENARIGSAIVNETMVRRQWPGEDPIGKRIRLRYKTPELYEIVGVARDLRQRSPWSDPEPYIYLPLYQRRFLQPILHVRSKREAREVSAAIEREVASMEPDLPAATSRTLSDLLDERLATERTAAALFGAAGFLALALAAAGVYGVLAYSVARRTREIGIRMALGADAGSVTRLVLRRGMTLAGLGIALGSAAALALTRFISGYLHGVSPADPLTFSAAVAILVLAAAAACYIPSRRAGRIDPSAALRSE